MSESTIRTSDELLVRHELMEAFLFDGVRLFDPHRTVDELAMPARERAAGGSG